MKASCSPPMFIAGAAAGIALAPVSMAEPPPPPPCVNADGFYRVPISARPDRAARRGRFRHGPGGTAGPQRASGEIPYGPGGARPGGATGEIPYGPSGTAGPGGATGEDFTALAEPRAGLVRAAASRACGLRDDPRTVSRSGYAERPRSTR